MPSHVCGPVYAAKFFIDIWRCSSQDIGSCSCSFSAQYAVCALTLYSLVFESGISAKCMKSALISFTSIYLKIANKAMHLILADFRGQQMWKLNA